MSFLLRRRPPRALEPSIIDDLGRLDDRPVPFKGDWQITPPPAHPPMRRGRRELYITGPQQPAFTPRRHRRGRVLLASRAMLPLFHTTAHVIGWRAVLPPPTARMGYTAALRSIEMYSDRTMRVICSQVEAARADLREQMMDFEAREAEIRGRRPLHRRMPM